jgi:hypothetical protein
MKVSKVITDVELLKTMKWITLQEASRYARMCSNKIKSKILEGKIYGTKKDGEWLVDRESIDSYFNQDRDDMRVRLGR